MIIIRHLFVIMMLASISIEGQPYSTSNHHIEYSIGLSQVKEENLIPKVHSGTMHFLKYELETRSNSYKCFELYVGYGMLKTEIENEKVSFNIRAGLNYCYDLKILGEESSTYYLGPYISFSSSLSEYKKFDEAHAYWGNFLSTGVSNIGSISIDQDKLLVCNINFSLLGFYTRPDYYRLYANEYWTFSNIIEIMNSHYKFGFIGNAFQLRTAVEYRTRVWDTKFLSLGLSMFFSRIKADDGKPLKELIPRISIGMWL